jgi:diguanylate cyclase (GGDEF)-like protein
MLNLKKQGQRSRKEAETDSLTGLLNRRTALSQLEREIQRIRRTRQPMVVLMLDLDHFKSMNDTYGHLTGDRILAKIGSVLKATLRGADIAARYGGEEFLVLQFDTTLEDASIVATRIYKAVEEAGRELAVPITVSIGVTDLRPDDTVESVLHRADKALYASKQRGRNRFSVDSQ